MSERRFSIVGGSAGVALGAVTFCAMLGGLTWFAVVHRDGRTTSHALSFDDLIPPKDSAAVAIGKHGSGVLTFDDVPMAPKPTGERVPRTAYELMLQTPDSIEQARIDNEASCKTNANDHWIRTTTDLLHCEYDGYVDELFALRAPMADIVQEWLESSYAIAAKQDAHEISNPEAQLEFAQLNERSRAEMQSRTQMMMQQQFLQYQYWQLLLQTLPPPEVNTHCEPSYGGSVDCTTW